MKRIIKIVSGGQTGADRAALDFALENQIEIGGFVPKNRRAEDGKIPEKYSPLTETASRNYAQRTEMNVRHSDATLILSHGKLTGGSLLTGKLAEKHQKPFLHIDFSKENFAGAVEKTKKWLDSINCRELNVAGARASADAEIYDRTRKFLNELFAQM